MVRRSSCRFIGRVASRRPIHTILPGPSGHAGSNGVNRSRMAGNRSAAMPHAGVADNDREPVGYPDRHDDLALVDELDRIGQKDRDEPSLGSTVSDNVPDERRLSNLLSIRRPGVLM